MEPKKPVDYWIFVTILILLAFGIVMVFSASSAHAYYYNKDSYFYLKSQLIYAVIGFICMFAAIKVDYRKLGKYSPVIFGISLILVLFVLVPGIGTQVNGARRWISILGQRFQPSEMLKISAILFLAHSVSKRRDLMKNFTAGLLPYLGIIAVMSFLLLLEPHLSCTMIIALVSCIILISGGARIKHFVYMAAPVIGVFTIVIVMVEYMRNRVLSFLDPFKYASGSGYQVVQSLYAMGSGGFFGRGLGKSMQKFLYIPEPQNDFIFSILGEELGFLGVVAVLVLFLIFVWRGIKVSINDSDMFGSLVAVGITSLVAIQTLMNVAVVTSSMPPTGVSLPFFSAGGTSLVMFMTAVGILLNISRYSNYERI